MLFSKSITQLPTSGSNMKCILSAASVRAALNLEHHDPDLCVKKMTSSDCLDQGDLNTFTFIKTG